MSNALNAKKKPNFLKKMKENPSSSVNVDAPSLFTQTEVAVLSNQEHLAAISEVLLEQFSELNEIFAEEDAFDPDKYKVNMGRLYRSWYKTRQALDPDFDKERHRYQWNI